LGRRRHDFPEQGPARGFLFFGTVRSAQHHWPDDPDYSASRVCQGGSRRGAQRLHHPNSGRIELVGGPIASQSSTARAAGIATALRLISTAMSYLPRSTAIN